VVRGVPEVGKMVLLIFGRTDLSFILLLVYTSILDVYVVGHTIYSESRIVLHMYH